MPRGPARSEVSGNPARAFDSDIRGYSVRSHEDSQEAKTTAVRRARLLQAIRVCSGRHATGRHQPEAEMSKRAWASFGRVAAVFLVCVAFGPGLARDAAAQA